MDFLDSILKNAHKKVVVKRVIAILSVVVMLFTVNSTRKFADTLERIPACGIEEHIHTEACFDADGNVACGLAEHVHTDACYQERPKSAVSAGEVQSPVEEIQDIELDDIEQSADDDAGDVFVDSDANFVGTDIDAPVEETEEQDLEDADEAADITGEEDADAPSDEAADTEAQPETEVAQGYIVGAQNPFYLSDIISDQGLDISIEDVVEVGQAVESDDAPVLFSSEPVDGDVALYVNEDFERAELAISTEAELYVVELLYGIAPMAESADGLDDMETSAETEEATDAEEAIPSEAVESDEEQIEEVTEEIPEEEQTEEAAEETSEEEPTEEAAEETSEEEPTEEAAEETSEEEQTEEAAEETSDEEQSDVNDENATDEEEPGVNDKEQSDEEAAGNTSDEEQTDQEKTDEAAEESSNEEQTEEAAEEASEEEQTEEAAEEDSEEEQTDITAEDSAQPQRVEAPHYEATIDLAEVDAYPIALTDLMDQAIYVDAETASPADVEEEAAPDAVEEAAPADETAEETEETEEIVEAAAVEPTRDEVTFELDGEDLTDPEVSGTLETDAWTLDYDAAALSIERDGNGYALSVIDAFKQTVVTVNNGELYNITLLNGSAPVLYPAAAFMASTDYVNVNVEAAEGAFPAGTTMVVADVEDEDTISGITDKVEEGFVRVERVHAVDITFLDTNGEEIEPRIPISVTMSVREIEQEKETVVIHVDHEGEAQVVDGAETAVSEANNQDGSVEAADEDSAGAGTAVAFSADSFSVYAIVVGEKLETKAIAADGSTYRIEVTYAEDAQIPVGATLAVEEVTGDAAYLSQVAEALPDGRKVSTARFFDIKIMDGAQEVQPSAPVMVRAELVSDGTQALDAVPCAVHFTDDAVDVINATESEAAVSFRAESFSVWGVVYTVDFHYEVDGKVYEFSLPGGGFVSLTDLVEALGLTGAAEPEAETDDIFTPLEAEDVASSDAAKAFVADVADVAFSSPELVDVSKAEADTTVGQIKELRGLEIQYSAELTEEQIEAINSSAVEAGDWALIGVQPFTTEESLTVTMKDGEVFTVKVTDAQINTQYLSTNGNLYEVTVIYGKDANIPNGASLHVTEYNKRTDEYQFVRKAVLGDDQTVYSEEAEGAIAELGEYAAEGASAIPENDEEVTDETDVDPFYREAVLEALDISILDESGEPIEPEATVEVRIVIKKLPDDKALFEETAAVQHLNTSSGEVQVETVADTDSIGGIRVSENTATADFSLDSFSQFAITYFQNNPRVIVNVHYVDNNGVELNGTTTAVTATSTQQIVLSSYQNGMNQNGYTYLGAHYGTFSGQVITSLRGTTSSSGSLSSSTYIVEFRNGDDIVARQEYESSQRQVDVYLVYAPSSGYYIQDTIGEDGCLKVRNETGDVQTGIDQNLFVRWYRSSNGTSDFEEVTQSKMLDSNYNIPELGGPKVNVAIDEGADPYYKSEIYKVENNEEVKLDETAVYHVPYYDDVRNGGFETPHNNTTNGSGRYWPSNYQVESGQEGVIWKTTGLGPAGKSKQDIEIPQGAAADGTGANNLGETLRNYCFAFMPEGNQCAELNCEASGALYQDVLTIPGSQMYWSLYHRARGGYDTWKTQRDKTQNKETDTMYVVAMSKDLAEKYDVTTQEKVLSVLAHVNDPDSEFHDVEIVRITTTNQGNGTMEFMNSDYSMTVPPTWFGNLANGRTATVYDSGTKLTFKYGNTDWHYYTGNFSIPQDQYLTRFFFVAGETASGNPTMGNFLDNIQLSDSVPSPNHGQATAIVQKTVNGLDTLPENYATRIETTYQVTSYSGIISSTVRNSDYDLYRTQIDEDGKAVSTASWTFPITIGAGDSAVFTNGTEVSPHTEGKTDEIDGYEQTTTWIISKRNANGEELAVIASGTGKEIPEAELAKMEITERDIVCIEFINSYRKKPPVSVWKTDMDSRTITTGAEFALYKAEEFDDGNNKPKDGAKVVTTGATGTNGILSLGELDQGEYRLLETKAPDGYNRQETAIKITVTGSGVAAMQGNRNSVVVTKGHEDWVEGQAEDTYQIQVWNNPGVVLPATGGPGTARYTITGMLLILAAATLLLRKRREN